MLFRSVPVHKLRQIVNFLLLNEYLMVTNDEYAVVRLTEKSALVSGQEVQITMKMAKEQERPAKTGGGRKRESGPGLQGMLSEGDGVLFEKLRQLRLEIARVEKVPPYIVFSDKTLTHMCSVKPKTKAEMLKVSGVGEYKFEKYGERFLQCVREG